MTYLINIFCCTENDIINQIDIDGTLEEAINLVNKLASDYSENTAFNIHILEDYQDGYEAPIAYKNPNNEWIIF